MLRVVVVDDEPAGRRAVTGLIARHPTLQLVGQAGSAAAAAAMIARLQPDAVFLDVQMAGGDGFRVMAEMPAPPKIVFVTAHAAYATRAFDVEAVDFLLKPVQPDRFARAVRRLQRALATPALATPARSARAAEPNRLAIASGRGTRIVALADLLAVHADGDGTQLRLRGGETWAGREPIGRLAPQLPMPPFLRLSRSLIVNTGAVAEMKVLSRDVAHLGLVDGSPPLLLGRTAAAALRRHLRGAA